MRTSAHCGGASVIDFGFCVGLNEFSVVDGGGLNGFSVVECGLPNPPEVETATRGLVWRRDLRVQKPGSAKKNLGVVMDLTDV